MEKIKKKIIYILKFTLYFFRYISFFFVHTKTELKYRLELQNMDASEIFTHTENDAEFGCYTTAQPKLGVQQDKSLIEEVRKILDAQKYCKECGKLL